MIENCEKNDDLEIDLSELFKVLKKKYIYNYSSFVIMFCYCFSCFDVFN